MTIRILTIATAGALLAYGAANGQTLESPSEVPTEIPAEVQTEVPSDVPGPDDRRFQAFDITPKQMGAINEVLQSVGVTDDGEIFYMILIRFATKKDATKVARIVRVPEEERVMYASAVSPYACLANFSKSETCYDSGAPARNYWCQTAGYSETNKKIQNDVYYGSTWLSTIDNKLSCGNLNWAPSSSIRNCVKNLLCKAPLP